MIEMIANQIPLNTLYSVAEKLNLLVYRLDQVEAFCRRHEWRRFSHGGFVPYVRHCFNEDCER